MRANYFREHFAEDRLARAGEMPRPSVYRRALKIVAKRAGLLASRAWGAPDPINAGSPMACPAAQTPLYVRPPLPDRFARSGFGTASMWPNALIYRVYLFKIKAKRRVPT
ncbi:MAG: hypothetical protein NVS4B4_02180 [Bradyrhizobium sp.]